MEFNHYHWSDCARHAEPAEPASGCDCGLGIIHDEILEMVSPLMHEGDDEFDDRMKAAIEKTSIQLSGWVLEQINATAKRFRRTPPTEAGQWISVKDRPPKSGQMVLVYTKTGIKRTMRYTNTNARCRWANSMKPLFWMDLNNIPEPPQEGRGAKS